MRSRDHTHAQYVRWQIKLNVFYFGGMLLLALFTVGVNRIGGWPKTLLDEIGVAVAFAWPVLSFWFFIAVIVFTLYVVAQGGLNRDTKFWRMIDNVERRDYTPRPEVQHGRRK